MGVRTFQFSAITCRSCGAAQKAARPRRACPACGRGSFDVEIERSASGFDPAAMFGSMGTVGSFIDSANDDTGSVFYRTHSVLRCSAVSGEELAGFKRASIDERKRLYIGWKRREIEVGLGPDQAICDRCGVAFRRYENPWNRAGLCSRSCQHAYDKSQLR